MTTTRKEHPKALFLTRNTTSMGKQKGEKLGSGQSKEDMFNGDGITFKCKLFGSTKVSAPRGNVICAEGIAKLKAKALQLRKDQKEHKQRIFINISVKGIRILDEETKKLEHAHLIHRISFICQDGTDKRCFCYIVSLKEGYTLFAFRTEKAAELITNMLKELFDVVFKIYTKQKAGGGGSMNTSAILTDRKPLEEAEEVKENPYDLPGPKHEQQPRSEEPTTTDDTGKLLDWSEVNDNIAIMQTNMKHSDSADLLADLANADFETFTPFSPDGDDQFFFGNTQVESTPSPAQGPDPFASNPFTASTGGDSSKAQVEASSAAGNTPNPFADDQFNANSRDEDNAVADGNNPFDAQTSSDLHDLDFAFSSGGAQPHHNQSAAPPAAQQPMGSVFDSLLDNSGDVLAPTITPGTTSAASATSNDPFSSLTSNIDNLRVDLPSSGNASGGFAAKPKEKATLNSLATSSSQPPRPVIPVMQPVNRTMSPPQPRPYGSNPMMPSQQYRQPMNASANNPFLNMGQAPQSMGMAGPMGRGSPQMSPHMSPHMSPQMSPHMQHSYYGQQSNQMSPATDVSQLYATVDKSSPGVDPLAQFGVLQKPASAKQPNNDLTGLDLLQ